MTIATCYLSPEGVVLGADSTTTFVTAEGNHYYNHAQKLFEIGESGSIGIVTWGLGGLGAVSYRRLFAKLADSISENPCATIHDVAQRWTALFWADYSTSPLLQFYQQLAGLQPHNPNVTTPDCRTAEQEDLLTKLTQNFIVGFCLGGRLLPDREPSASVIIFTPNGPQPVPVAVPMGSFQFWGAPNMIKRLIYGYDDNLHSSLMTSPHWTGTLADLENLLAGHRLAHNVIPIRDAIDFVYSCISSTIKALKFSNYSQICGGPIEIAVITADRPFRWVRHKPWDSAIIEGAP